MAPALAAGPPCGAPDDMMRKAADAWEQNRYESAIPKFECAVQAGDSLQKLHAEFYLARIFGDDTGGFVDHAKAYTLYQGIAEAADTVDPDDRRRAPFIAKAVTAIAGYVRRGLPEIGLKSDVERSVEYYRTAATTFDEPDAQFEIGKMHLTGTGVPKDLPLGLHYIQKLVRDGHAGAQAFLADLYWRGNLAPAIAKDPSRALALSKLAVENAKPSDRLWIEDGYQHIYCGLTATERTRAAQVSENLRNTYVRNPDGKRQTSPETSALGRQPSPSRACANREPVDMELRASPASPPLASSLTQAAPQQTIPAGMRPPTR